MSEDGADVMNMQTRFIGVDIGGTTTKIALVDQKGIISDFVSIKTIDDKNQREKYLSSVYSEISKIVSESSSKVGGIGVSMLGLQMDDKSGTLFSANAPGFNKFNIRESLCDEFSLPVLVSNDLTAHALAEYCFGVGKEYNRFLSVAMGTGIGCTMITDGNPVILFGGTTGDCGRIILDPESDIVCGGNVRGSAEGLCGTGGIEHLAKKYYGEDSTYSARDVISSARDNGDDISLRIMEEVGQYLGHLLANLSVIFFPQVIALTGGTVEAGQVLVDSCKRQFDTMVGEFFDGLHKAVGVGQIDIQKATMGKDAGIVGAVVPFLSENKS